MQLAVKEIPGGRYKKTFFFLCPPKCSEIWAPLGRPLATFIMAWPRAYDLITSRLCNEKKGGRKCKFSQSSEDNLSGITVE